MTPLPRWVDIGLLPLINLALALAVAGAVVALIGNGLWPWDVVRTALRGAHLDELRDGPLDKHGAGSRILRPDGTVDAADYVLWRNGGPLMNDSTPAGVGPEDYTVWRTNFGRTSGAGSAAASAVPEPSTLLLLCLTAVVGVLGGRRHARC